MKRKKNSRYRHIVTQKGLPNQAARLKKYVRDRQLTDAIGLLEKHGFSDDGARLIVAYMQYESGVKHELL